MGINTCFYFVIIDISVSGSFGYELLVDPGGIPRGMERAGLCVLRAAEGVEIFISDTQITCADAGNCSLQKRKAD